MSVHRLRPRAAPTPFALMGAAVVAMGYKVLPIKPGTKLPGTNSMGRWYPMKDWPQHKTRALGPYDILIWGGWEDAGIGVVLGNETDPGWEVACVDHDTDDLDIQDAVDGALRRSPVEKRGRRGFTGFYQVPAGTVGRRFKRGAETVLELLTGTNTRQTVLPPSVHPDTGRACRKLRR